MTSPDAAWESLGPLLVQRRVELSPRYGNRSKFATERGVDYRLVYDIEKVRRQNFGDGPIASLEHAYELAPGAIKRYLTEGGVLDTGKPVEPVAPPVQPVQPVPVEQPDLAEELADLVLRRRVEAVEQEIRAEVRAGRNPFPGNELAAQVIASSHSEDYIVTALAIIAMARQRQKREQGRRTA